MTPVRFRDLLLTTAAKPSLPWPIRQAATRRLIR